MSTKKHNLKHLLKATLLRLVCSKNKNKCKINHVDIWVFLCKKVSRALVHSFQSIEESTYHKKASNGAGNQLHCRQWSVSSAI